MVKFDMLPNVSFIIDLQGTVLAFNINALFVKQKVSFCENEALGYIRAVWAVIGLLGVDI